jgi:prepilin-type N-terminal cleavage/methylation domain-containing protein
MRRRFTRGFTLVELMLVVLIIGIISSFAIPYYQRMTARAYRGEALTVISKMRLYYRNLYDNQATFASTAVPVGSSSALNPPGPPGDPSSWVTTANGWRDMPFPPEGAIRMRYLYTVQAPDQMVITACGNFAGFGAPFAPCPDNSVQGNYVYTETLHGSAYSDIAEVPTF